MAQGRGNAVGFAIAIIMVCLVVQEAEAEVYTVGDQKGWSFNVSTWPCNKTFKAGDQLYFKYNVVYHNVVVVNKKGYQQCVVNEGDEMYNRGNEQLKLVKGPNYFICSFPPHCLTYGMKLAIYAH